MAKSASAAAAARGGMSGVILQTFSRGLALLFVLYVTREVGPSAFGRYSVVSAIVVLANLLSDFGTSSVIAKVVARGAQSSHQILEDTLLFSTVVGVLSLAASLLWVKLAGYPSQIRLDMLIAGAGIPAWSVSSSLMAALDGRGEMVAKWGITFLQTGLFAVGGIAAVRAGLGVRGAIIALGTAPWIVLLVASLVAARTGTWRFRVGVNLAATRELVRLAVPFALSGGITALILRFDVILLSVLKGPAEVARYDISQRIVESLGFLSGAIAGPATVILSSRFGQRDMASTNSAYRQAIWVIYVLGLPISVAGVILAPNILNATVGTAYAGAATPLAIMLAGTWLAFVANIQNVAMLMGYHLRTGLALSGLNLAVIAGLDSVLIPRYGATGAASAMLVGWSFMVANYGIFHARVTGLRTPLPPLRVVAAAALCGATVLLEVNRYSLVLVVASGCVAYLAALFVARAVSIADVRRLLSYIKERTP